MRHVGFVVPADVAGGKAPASAPSSPTGEVLPGTREESVIRGCPSSPHLQQVQNQFWCSDETGHLAREEPTAVVLPARLRCAGRLLPMSG